jgi:hypothetical protein
MTEPSEGTANAPVNGSQETPPPIKIPQSPGGKAMGPFGIGFIAVYFVLTAILVGNGLIVLWPPGPKAAVSPSGQDEGGQKPKLPQKPPVAGTPALHSETTPPMGTDMGAGTTAPMGTEMTPPKTADQDKKESTNDEKIEKCKDFELFWFYGVCLSDEQRLLLLVILAGTLGSLVHGLRSFFWYAGNRNLVSSWAGMYLTLPFLGAAMAAVFYLIVRGGFFPQARLSETNPMSFVAVAALIGMFTEQAAQKLKDIADTFFAPAPKGADHAGAPTLTKIEPNHGHVGDEVTISGTGFVEKTTVKFGKTAAAPVTFISSTSIKVKSPQGETGTVAVEVTNPDGLKVSLDKGFTYDTQDQPKGP